MENLKSISSLLTEEYLSKKLSEWFKEDVIFTNVEFLGNATGKGDSYLSDVYRIIFYGEMKKPNTGENGKVSVQVVLKAFPKHPAYRKTFRSHTFFRNEVNFYNIIMPELLKFQSEKNIDDPYDNLPKLFAAETNGIDDFVAMEDLHLLNYSMPVRQDNIDANHMNKILETFAKFHALSFAFKDQNPETYKKLTTFIEEVYYNPKYWDWYKGFWKKLCGISVDAVGKEIPGSIYEKKVKEFAVDETFNKMVKIAMTQRDSDVISHGDSWTPNFLFQYENNIPVKSMMIDFQLTRSASPILDVSFSIYACGSERSYLENNYDAMLKFYYDRMAKQITDLGSDPNKVYPWDMFLKEVKELSSFGAAFSMEAIPVIVLEPDEAMGIEISGTEAVRVEEVWNVGPIKSKKGRQRLCDVLMHAVNRGYI